MLSNPEGIGYGPFTLTPGNYRIEVDPEKQNPGVATVWVIQEKATQGMRYDRVLEPGRPATIRVELEQGGSYLVKLRTPGRSWAPQSITLKLTREPRWTWAWLVAGGLMLGLAARLFTVHVRLLRDESF